MALDKSTLQASLKTALTGYNTTSEVKVKTQVKAAVTASLTEFDPANQATAVDAWADAIAKAVTSDLNGEDAMTDLANAIGNAIDVYVKSGTVTTTVTGTLPNGAEAAAGSGSIA